MESLEVLIDSNYNNLSKILNSSSFDTENLDALKKLKTFFDSCTDTEAIDRRGVQPLLELLNETGTYSSFHCNDRAAIKLIISVLRLKALFIQWLKLVYSYIGQGMISLWFSGSLLLQSHAPQSAVFTVHVAIFAGDYFSHILWVSLRLWIHPK